MFAVDFSYSSIRRSWIRCGLLPVRTNGSVRQPVVCSTHLYPPEVQCVLTPLKHYIYPPDVQYSSREVLRQRMECALDNAEGFGLI